MNPFDLLLWLWNTSQSFYSFVFGFALLVGLAVMLVTGVWRGVCAFGNWLGRP